MNQGRCSTKAVTHDEIITASGEIKKTIEEDRGHLGGIGSERTIRLFERMKVLGVPAMTPVGQSPDITVWISKELFKKGMFGVPQSKVEGHMFLHMRGGLSKAKLGSCGRTGRVPPSQRLVMVRGPTMAWEE